MTAWAGWREVVGFLIREKEGKKILGIGKIYDIFVGSGVSEKILTKGNTDGLNKTLCAIKESDADLIFTNLVDTDMLYGHRNNAEGYAKAIEEIDSYLPKIMNAMTDDDLLIITADHGNDPTFTSNGHTRENVPVIIYSRNFKEPHRLAPFETFADIGATIAENFDLDQPEIGKSILDELE